jgi:hypothetical protein
VALDSGTYTVSVSQKGFATTARDLIVATGINVEVTFTLGAATVEETVTVTAETQPHGQD